METEIVRTYKKPYKRFCFALDLKNDPELITEYLKYHSPEHFWKVIGEGIKKAGVDVMDIYNVDNRLFMICEIPVEVDFDEAWQKMGTFERQAEWGALMSQFQQALPGHKQEWVKMNKVY
ncbi:MAG: L-rhamnose mutarotase [Paludibacter sp.]